MWSFGITIYGFIVIFFETAWDSGTSIVDSKRSTSFWRMQHETCELGSIAAGWDIECTKSIEGHDSFALHLQSATWLYKQICYGTVMQSRNKVSSSMIISCMCSIC